MAKNATIYVGNAPYSITEQELRDLFTPRNIVRVTIVMDPQMNRPRGFSFVEFASQEDADSAVAEFNGTQFGNRTLKISIAQDRSGGGNNRGGRAPGRPRREDDFGWRK